jgi:hypothetical protein
LELPYSKSTGCAGRVVCTISARWRSTLRSCASREP